MADFIHHFQTFARQNDLNPDPQQDKTAAALDALWGQLTKPSKKLWFKKTPMPKGLYIWGGVGRGKTMIMDLFYETIPLDKKCRVHFNIFMLDVQNSLKILREDGKGKNPLPIVAAEIAENCGLLCFDEFQVYDIADAMILAGLFDALFKAGVTVIATSNVAPENLYKDGLQRARFLPFIDILQKRMNIIHLDSNKDYRQQALRENGVYFYPASQGGTEKMNDLFHKLIAPHEADVETIQINKTRQLPILKAADGNGWVSFSELCEKPRAAADYKKLAEHYHTVFIDHVPRMGYDRRNEIKRFILLIDTLYDNGNRVVISADTPPDKLYSEGDHSFEFQRTISRLLEMQGEAYLSKTASHKFATT